MLREVKLRLQEGTLEEAIQKSILSSVVTQEEPNQQESQPVIEGSEWEAFDTQISSLTENLFWHGQEQAVSTLLTAWRALKETMGRE
ncbi:hypothetical protein D3C75_581730 [compost metagenome]